jgi:hypothetical protein
MLSRIWCVALAASVVGAIGCSQGPSAPDPDPGEVVPAADALTMPGGAVAVRYWGELNPKSGQVDLYPIHEGNRIFRSEKITSAVNYQYTTATQQSPACTPGGSCLPATDTVTLFTDQNTVTYVEGGTCVKNGVNFPGDPTCGGFYQAGHVCTNNFTFCGDVQITSNYAAGALPDVVIDVGNVAGQTSTVLGCLRNTSAGGEGGLCSDDGPAKISPATSNFVPQIPRAVGTFPCAYCYGNKSRAVATNRPALQHAVISGVSAEKASADTNKFVLKLSSGASLNITFIVYYALPAVNAPGAQLSYSDQNNVNTSCISTRPTRALVRGGGFGPPAECVAATFPASCPLAGAPRSGSTLDFAGLPGQAPLEWSDVQVRSQDLTADRYGCPVTLTTPLGTITTDDDLKLCSAVVRKWAPTGYLGRTHFGSGKISNFAVIMGGMSAANSATSGTNTIQVMPLPRCSGFTPAFTTLSTTLPAGAGLWGAASTTASDGIYYIGGASSGNTCSAQALRLSYSGGATATITALPNLPINLCHATAVTVSDGGAEYVVVTGGLTLPVPRFPNTPAVSAADLAPTASYVWTVGGAAWATFPGNGLARWNMGGAGSGGSAIFVGGATAVSTAAPAVTTVSVLTAAGGVPSYSAGASLPVARSVPGVVARGTGYFVQGGATTTSSVDAGRLEMFSSNSAGGAWTSASGGMLLRQGGMLFVSDFAETPPADTLSRVIAVGGNDYTAFPTLAAEWNP